MKQESNAPAPAPYIPQAKQEILRSDVIIPKLLLMQGLSDFVMERKAQSGDMVRSTTAEKMGGEKAPINIIPLSYVSLWMNSEKIGVKYEFRGYEPRTAKNEMWPWEFKENGADWKRTKVMHLFALLPQDIDSQSEELAKFKSTGEMPDFDKALLPVVIPFRGMSYTAAKSVASFFTKVDSLANQAGEAFPSYGMTLPLSCVLDKNDKGTYYVYEVGKAMKTAEKYLKAAATWHETIGKMGTSLKVDEADVGEDSENQVPKSQDGPSRF